MAIALNKILSIPLLCLPCALLFACTSQPKSSEPIGQPQENQTVTHPAAGKLIRVDWDGHIASTCNTTFTPSGGGDNFTVETDTLLCDPQLAVIGQTYQLEYENVIKAGADCNTAELDQCKGPLVPVLEKMRKQ